MPRRSTVSQILHGRLTVASGASVAFLAQVASYLLGFVGTILIARALGPHGRGEYYVPVVAAASCQGVLHLGLELSNTFYFAEKRYQLRTLASNAAVVALGIAPIAIAAMFAFFVLARTSVFRDVDVFNFALVTATVPLQVHQVWMVNLYLLGGRLLLTQVVTVIVAVLQTGAAIALYASGLLNVRAVIVLYSASMVISWALFVIWARSFAPMRPKTTRRVLRDTLRLGVKLHIGFIFWFLLLRSDVFLVTAILGTREVGIYSLAVLYAEFIVLLTNPLVSAALPFQSTASIPDAAVLTFKVVRFNVLIALVLCVLAAALLWIALPLLYGARFEPAFPAFVALLPGVTAMAAFRPLYNWLLRQDRPWRLTAITFGSFALNFALNLALLNPLGLVGAGIASSIAYIVLTGAFLLWGARIVGSDVRGLVTPTAEDLATLRSFVRNVVGRLTRPRVRPGEG